MMLSKQKELLNKNMKKEEIKLKALAENHILFGKSINKLQFELIKNSKYGKYLQEETYKPKFEKLFENVLQGKPTEKVLDTEEDYPEYMFNINTDKGFIDFLVHELEDRFDVGPFNNSLKKYNNIDLKEVVDFIKSYIIKNKLDHKHTLDRLNDSISRAKTAKDLIFDIRSLSL